MGNTPHELHEQWIATGKHPDLVPTTPFIDVVFDGPPAAESGRFVECEDETGRSINAGEWIERGDGLWALRIPR